jgi:hypothetical protein
MNSWTCAEGEPCTVEVMMYVLQGHHSILLVLYDRGDTWQAVSAERSLGLITAYEVYRRWSLDYERNLWWYYHRNRHWLECVWAAGFSTPEIYGPDWVVNSKIRVGTHRINFHTEFWNCMYLTEMAFTAGNKSCVCARCGFLLCFVFGRPVDSYFVLFLEDSGTENFIAQLVHSTSWDSEEITTNEYFEICLLRAEVVCLVFSSHSIVAWESWSCKEVLKSVA